MFRQHFGSGLPTFSQHSVRRLTHAVGLQVAFGMPRILNNIHRTIMQAGQSFSPSLPNIGRLPRYLPNQGYPENWPRIRRWVLKRDGYQCRATWMDGYGITHRCQNRKHLHVHHLIPLSKGGSSTAENLETQCEGHHVSQHPHLRNYINHPPDFQPYFPQSQPYYSQPYPTYPIPLY